MSNREIKFRLWDTELKKFVDTNIMDVALTFEGRPILLGDCGGYCNYIQGIIQQYTEVNDKNGKPIFEGDFLRYSGLFCNFPVEFKRGCFYVAICYDLTEFTLFELLESELEIVGNIFENPELIYNG